MKASLLPFAIAATLLLGLLSLSGQSPTPGGPGAGRTGRGGPFGPALPQAQQAEVDRILATLETESRAVTVAHSNLVAAALSRPDDKAGIAAANEALTRARAAWAAKASQLVTQAQASDKKLSPEALNRLVQLSSGGRGGRGGGPGTPGGDGPARRTGPPQ